MLFLTTNRIKTFDEAFISRFSIGMMMSHIQMRHLLTSQFTAIKYPDLDDAARRLIWKKFFEKEQKDTASTDSGESDLVKVNFGISDADMSELSAKPFNGTRHMHIWPSASISDCLGSQRSDDQEFGAHCPSPGTLCVSDRSIKSLSVSAPMSDLRFRNETLPSKHVQMVVRVQEKFVRDFTQNM